MLTLYFSPGSSSMAPHIAVHEIGVPFEARPISLARRENRTPGYLALNPEGKVPALLIEDRPLTEVAAILFYLERTYSDARLIPNGVEAEARAISWMSYAASTLQGARHRGVDRAIEIWSIADQRLGDCVWVLGAYSIADIHIFRLFWRLNGTFALGAGTFPNLMAHPNRMLARPAVRRTLADEAAIPDALST